jgi:hypothetical protein
MCDLKQQMREMEKNNTRYLEQIIQLEEVWSDLFVYFLFICLQLNKNFKDVKKISTLKSQIEMYKKQIQEFHEKILNDEMKMKKLQYEYKSIEESHLQTENNLRIEKERIQSEYQRLKETHEQLLVNSQAFQTERSNIIN